MQDAYSTLPRITTEQMIEVDRLMIEVYHIELIQMMENAGRCLAITARDHFFQGDCQGKRVIVLAGTGGNGGGAMVCARRLAAWGARVSLVVSKPDRLRPIPQHQFDIVQRMQVEILPAEALAESALSGLDLIIDGIIGYSLKGNPRGLVREMIIWANAHPSSVLSLDTPSGLSLTTGIAYDPIIQATATLTLALPKVGLFEPAIKPLRGDLYLGDISVPPELYAEPSLGLSVAPIFSTKDIIRLD